MSLDRPEKRRRMDPDPPADDSGNVTQDSTAMSPTINSTGEEGTSSRPDAPQLRHEIQQVFDEFAGSMTNLFQESRERSLVSLNETFQSFGQKIEHNLKLHCEERVKLNQDYCTQMAALNEMMIKDAEKIKEVQYQCAVKLQHHRMLFLNFQVTQRKYMEEVKELFEKHLESLKELTDDQEIIVADKLRELMASLEENILKSNEKMKAFHKSLLEKLFS